MARQPRAISRIGYYHVVSRGNNHREIFEKEVDFQVYCHLLRSIVLGATWISTIIA